MSLAGNLGGAPIDWDQVEEETRQIPPNPPADKMHELRDDGKRYRVMSSMIGGGHEAGSVISRRALGPGGDVGFLLRRGAIREMSEPELAAHRASMRPEWNEANIGQDPRFSTGGGRPAPEAPGTPEGGPGPESDLRRQAGEETAPAGASGATSPQEAAARQGQNAAQPGDQPAGSAKPSDQAPVGEPLRPLTLPPAPAQVGNEVDPKAPAKRR